MSSQYDDEDTNLRAKRIVDETQEEVQAVRNRVWSQHLRGGVGMAGRRRLAEVVVQYWDVLKKHRDENEDLWQECGLHQIRDLAFQTRSVPQQAAGHTSATQSVDVPALVALDISQLLKLTDRLDDFAKHLGFAPPTKDRTPHDDGTMDDLRYLLEARGQSEALERLPDQPAEEVEQ